jgi:hypothetical protein
MSPLLTGAGFEGSSDECSHMADQPGRTTDAETLTLSTTMHQGRVHGQGPHGASLARNMTLFSGLPAWIFWHSQMMSRQPQGGAADRPSRLQSCPSSDGMWSSWPGLALT